MTNASKALDQLISNRFDIVFSDIQLPDFDGYELAKIVRSMQHTQTGIPLIAITANSTEDLAQQ